LARLFTIAEDGPLIFPDENHSGFILRVWLELLLEHFFKTAGLVLNGEVQMDCDELDDRGSIFKNRRIELVVDVAIHPGPSWFPERFANRQLTDSISTKSWSPPTRRVALPTLRSSPLSWSKRYGPPFLALKTSP